MNGCASLIGTAVFISAPSQLTTFGICALKLENAEWLDPMLGLRGARESAVASALSSVGVREFFLGVRREWKGVDGSELVPS